MRSGYIFHDELREILSNDRLPDVKSFPLTRVSIPVQMDLELSSDRTESVRFLREARFAKEVAPNGDLVWALITPCIV